MTVSTATRIGGVIGWPVEHSKSPALHNAAFAAAGIDAAFAAFAVPPGRAAEAIRGMAAMGFLGASVTVPHKLDAMAACDELDLSAQAVGAVNCVVFASGRAIGHNTDAGGFVDSLIEGLGVEIAGLRPLILGGGGAARAVVVGLGEAGAQTARIVARTPARVDWADDVQPWTGDVLAREAARCDLLVDCTSIGLSAEREAAVPAPIPVDRLPDGAAVATLVYHRETALLRAARQRGLPTLDGAGMLVHQGARAFRLWTGQDAPIEAMWRAMARE